VVIYANGSYSRFIKSIISLTGVLINGFLGVIKCVKEWLVNIIIILKA
jgi:hypothetical protein